MRLLRPGFLNQPETDPIRDHSEGGDDDHRLEVRHSFRKEEPTDHLRKAEQRQQHLENTADFSDLFLGRHCRAHGHQTQGIDDGVGQHVE